jgi:hypothetical protein
VRVIPGSPAGIFIMTCIIVLAGYFALKWAYADYYVATHCTMVLGTRVCQ